MSVERITKVAEFKWSDFYKAHCACGSDEDIHTLIINVEEDEDFPGESMNLEIHHNSYTPYKLHLDSSYTRSQKLYYWYLDKVTRLIWIWSIISKGYVQTESYFMFEGMDQIDAYIKALKQSKDKLALRASRKRRMAALKAAGVLDKDGVLDEGRFSQFAGGHPDSWEKVENDT